MPSTSWILRTIHENMVDTFAIKWTDSISSPLSSSMNRFELILTPIPTENDPGDQLRLDEQNINLLVIFFDPDIWILVADCEGEIWKKNWLFKN